MKELFGRIWTPAYAQIDLKNVTFYIRDGSMPYNEIEIKIGEGNFTYTENYEREYNLDRGRLDEVRNGDEQPMDVVFDFVWDYIEGTTGTGCVPTVEDALKRRGCAADWISTDDDQCAPYAVDIVIDNNPDCVTDVQDSREILTFPDFRVDTLAHDADAGSVSATGRCNAIEPLSERQ